MKVPYKISLLFIMMMAVSLMANTSIQNDLDQIALAIKSGNAKVLAQYFDNSVEITTLDKEGAYSRSQAELVVKDFFSKNTPKSFNIIHQGSSGGNSKYGIGTLVTTSGSYRTYVYIKKVGTANLIQELRFEREN
jgi:hypothetical protein